MAADAVDDGFDRYGAAVGRGPQRIAQAGVPVERWDDAVGQVADPGDRLADGLARRVRLPTPGSGAAAGRVRGQP